LLALWLAVLSMLYVRTFYGITALFHRLPMPRMLKPAVGAFLTGAVGLALYFALGRSMEVLSVLSYGYGMIRIGLGPGGDLTAALLLAVALGKTFSTLIIVSEMTGDYKLLLPALWVCTIAFLVSDGQPLYRSQVESRSRSPAHQGSYVREVLAGLRVVQFLKPGRAFPSLQTCDTLPTISKRFDETGSPVLPVLDEGGRLQGIVVLEEVHLAAQAAHAQAWLLAADLMRSLPRPLRPEDRLDKAMELFAEYDLLALPVEDPAEGRRIVGVVRRSDLAQAYLRQLHGQKTEEVQEADRPG
jgi:CIC family chloride channel protein